MRGAEFKERALVEGQRYARDRMVFLRELAQNARDAGARRIGVTAGFEAGELVLTFADNGAGMDFEHAKDYLFTLYASSKEDEDRSAGSFGVGFWSVLLFSPSSIEIESRTEIGASWKVILDGDLSKPTYDVCMLSAPGTRVILRRPVASSDEFERIQIEIERALGRYCRYLRRNDKKAEPLPITFNQKSIDEEFSLDGPCWLTFRDGPVEGAVGLGERPSVEVYARGLLVWQGTLLDELRYGAEPNRPIKHPEGLAPVYLINGNDLNVTMDRRAVIDDRALARLRRTARSRMRELLHRYLDGISPRPLHVRAADLIADLLEESRLRGYTRLVVAAVGVVALLGIAAFFAARWLESDLAGFPGIPFLGAGSAGTGGQTGVEAPRPLTNPRRFQGPAVDPLGRQRRLALEYSPPVRTALRTSAVEVFDPGRGLVDVVPKSAGSAPPYRCASGCLDVTAEVDAGPGPLVLPVPTGYAVEPESVKLDGQSLKRLEVSRAGEPLIALEASTVGGLMYRAGPAPAGAQAPDLDLLLGGPAPGSWPPEIEAMAQRALQGRDLAERVERARSLVESRLHYDRSAAVSSGYATFLSGNPKGGWLDFVLAYGRGDCDVKNAVLVAILRRLKVPARLAVGPIGIDGRAAPGMHAWVEYHDRGWKAVDATGPADPAGTAALPGPSRLHEGSMLNQPVGGAGTKAGAGDSVSPQELAAPTQRGIEAALDTISMVAAIVLGLSVLTVIVLMVFRLGRGTLFEPGGDDTRRFVAANMVASALSHPEAWTTTGGLKRRGLLPVLRRKKGMSLEQALERARRGRLWLSKGSTGLARQAVKNGICVLDASDPAFEPIIARLPGIVDLDEIAGLRPFGPSKLPPELSHVGRLIERVNRLLELGGLPGRSVRLTYEPLAEFGRDVDLSGLGMGHLRFVVVPARSSALIERAIMARSEPGLAVFMTLDKLISASDLLGNHKERLRALAARAAIDMKT